MYHFAAPWLQVFVQSGHRDVQGSHVYGTKFQQALYQDVTIDMAAQSVPISRLSEDCSNGAAEWCTLLRTERDVRSSPQARIW